MSDEQSAPVEPEALPRPSTDAEPGHTPGAGAPEVDGNAEFATPAEESTPRGSAPTEAETAAIAAAQTQVAAAADAAEQTEEMTNAPAAPSGSEPEDASLPTASIPAQGEPGAPENPAWAGFTSPFMTPPAQLPAKPRSKAVLGTRIGLGYAALAAVTAFAVIAIGSPGPVHVAGVADSNAQSLTSASTAPSPSATAGSAAPSTAPPTTATPTSTVTGHVSGSVHSGDLRYFLLPPPDGASSVQGDPDGTSMTLGDLVDQYGGSSNVKSILKQLAFKSACDRVFQDSSIGANVDIQLIRFGSSDDASAWLSGFEDSGKGIKSIKVPGVSGAKAYSSKQDDSYYMVSAYKDGDTFFEVDIYGTKPISASSLASVVKAERSRLTHG